MGRTTRTAGGDGRRLRVLVVAEARPALGGISTYAETVVADPVLGSWFDIELLNTTRRAVRVGGKASLGNVRNALVDSVRVLRRGRKADVVHVQTPLLPLLPLLRVTALCVGARASGAGVLCHVHTGQANAGPYETFEPGRAVRLLLRVLGWSANTVLTVSPAGSAGLAPFLRGTPVVDVDNAVDTSRIPAAIHDGGAAVILYLGAIGRAKGLIDLLSALEQLRARGVGDWTLEVVGGANQLGAEEMALVHQAYSAAGLGHAILGQMEFADARRRLERAGLLVLPSHSEGQPMVVLEAMAAGVPVVATHVGGVPNTVRDRVDGFVVPPRDPTALSEAIGTLVLDPALRQEMGAAARARAQSLYDLGTLRARLAELYRDAARS